MLDELEVREWLWLNHGCPIAGLYGDDGEMQCAQGHVEDYKRAPLLDILKRWFERTQRDLAAKDSEVLAVLNGIPGSVHVRESNGPESIYASLAVSVARVVHDLTTANRMESLLQQFSQELGTALQLRGDGTLNLSEAVQEKFREKEAEIAAAQTKLSNAINTEFREQSRLIGERDAARDLVEQEKSHSSDLFEQKERLRYECDELKKRIAALLAVKETA